MSAAMEDQPRASRCVCGCGSLFRPLRMRHGVEWVGECIGAMRLRRGQEASTAAPDEYATRQQPRFIRQQPRKRSAKVAAPPKPKAGRTKPRNLTTPRSEAPDGYGSRREMVAALARNHGVVSIGILRAEMGLDPVQASNTITAAHRDGHIERIRRGVYRLAGGSD